MKQLLLIALVAVSGLANAYVLPQNASYEDIQEAKRIEDIESRQDLLERQAIGRANRAQQGEYDN